MVYYRPNTLEDAVAWLAENQATIAAGCTDLFPATSHRQLYGPILDITAVKDLKGIAQTPIAYRIGAAATWTDILNANLPPAFDGLKLAAQEVGSIQIQNAGTVAGNLCNASPAADGVPPLLTLEARVELASTAGVRSLALSEFILGPRQTALQKGELVTAILIPKSAAQGTAHFIKLGARRYLVISIAMVAVRLVAFNNHIEEVALSVGSCSAVATRLTALESWLKGQTITPDLSTQIPSDLVHTALAPISDVRADAGYRQEAAYQLIRRAIAAVLHQERSA